MTVNGAFRGAVTRGVELADGAQRSGVATGRECQGAGHAVPRRPASTVGCPPIRFPRPGSGRPTVRCPAVRCPAVRCPVSWFRRPGSNRPAGWCPSGPLLVGGSPAVAVGITSGAGQPCGRDGSGCRWSAGPERLGRRPESAWRGRCCGGRPVGERRSRTWPGRARAQAATVLDRWPAGRPAWREGRRSLPASGRGWHLAWGMTTLRGRCGV
jgi:hypothetical protein